MKRGGDYLIAQSRNLLSRTARLATVIASRHIFASIAMIRVSSRAIAVSRSALVASSRPARMASAAARAFLPPESQRPGTRRKPRSL